jgi:phage tail-like protein
MVNPLQPAISMLPGIPGFGSGGNDAMSFGLAMRFKVTVDGLRGGSLDLGHWSACKGLRANYNPQLIKQSGNSAYQHILPGDITYPVVQLERAMETESSRALQAWLRQQADLWIRNEGAELYRGTTAKIALLDRGGDEVSSWNLRSVLPSAWIGPTLSANDNKVAIETLELVHQGFL